MENFALRPQIFLLLQALKPRKTLERFDTTVFFTGLPEPVIFYFSGSGSGQISAPAPTPTPTL